MVMEGNKEEVLSLEKRLYATSVKYNALIGDAAGAKTGYEYT